jgi:hypothetical protein
MNPAKLHDASHGILHSINVSDGGVPKLPRPWAHVRAAGVEGDRQENPIFHGGPDRAVCLYSSDLIEALQGEGHPIRPGTIGENLTLAGIDWTAMRPTRGSRSAMSCWRSRSRHLRARKLPDRSPTASSSACRRRSIPDGAGSTPVSCGKGSSPRAIGSFCSRATSESKRTTSGASTTGSNGRSVRTGTRPRSRRSR